MKGARSPSRERIGPKLNNGEKSEDATPISRQIDRGPQFEEDDCRGQEADGAMFNEGGGGSGIGPHY